MCFTSFRLLELEVSGYRGAVCCGHRQAIALAHLVSTLGCRPVVDELTSSRIVAEARTTRRHCLDRIFRLTSQGAATDRIGLYRGDSTGAGQLGAANALEELELHRYGQAVLDGIHGVVHVDRLVEAAEVIRLDRVGARCRVRIGCLVLGRRRYRVGAYGVAVAADCAGSVQPREGIRGRAGRRIRNGAEVVRAAVAGPADQRDARIGLVDVDAVHRLGGAVARLVGDVTCAA